MNWLRRERRPDDGFWVVSSCFMRTFALGLFVVSYLSRRFAFLATCR